MLMSLLMIGCSDKKPGKSSAVKQIEAHISQTFGKIAEVTDVNYVNGYEEDENHYIVLGESTLRFTVSRKDVPKGIFGRGVLNEFKTLAFVSLLMVELGDWQAGEQFTVSNSYRFLKTEKGWALMEPDGIGNIRQIQ